MQLQLCGLVGSKLFGEINDWTRQVYSANRDARLPRQSDLEPLLSQLLQANDQASADSSAAFEWAAEGWDRIGQASDCRELVQWLVNGPGGVRLLPGLDGTTQIRLAAVLNAIEHLLTDQPGLDDCGREYLVASEHVALLHAYSRGTISAESSLGNSTTPRGILSWIDEEKKQLNQEIMSGQLLLEQLETSMEEHTVANGPLHTTHAALVNSAA